MKINFIKKGLLAFFLLFGVAATAQDYNSYDIEQEFDFLTGEWLKVSGELKTYSGLAHFCKSPDFRTKTTDILELIHHYDSIVLAILKDPTLEMDVSHREYKQTVRDIENFEADYGIKTFLGFLKESCGTWRDLEQNKSDLVNESGMYSYDGQILVLETGLRKFLKHIDKRLIAIDDHVQLIPLEEVEPYMPLSERRSEGK